MIKLFLLPLFSLFLIAGAHAEMPESFKTRGKAHIVELTNEANAGNAEAQADLASIYLFGTLNIAEVDLEKAIFWGLKAANQGHVRAQSLLGIAYYDERNFVEAFYWNSRAAAKGYESAQLSLGLMYKEGRGVKVDYVKAREWFKKSAAQGNDLAQLELGHFYALGRGVRQNLTTAKEWFGQACDNGNQDGCDIYRMMNESKSQSQ